MGDRAVNSNRNDRSNDLSPNDRSDESDRPAPPNCTEVRGGIRIRSMLTLMAITDKIRDGESISDFATRIAGAARGGATSIQVRLKTEPASVILEATREIMKRVTVPVIVNDRFDIALAAGCHGVHLGADDIPVSAVRKHTPESFIIGTSVGCTDEVANSRDADFVGIGPVYNTGSKADAGNAIGLDGLQSLMHQANKPTIAIGGITISNAHEVLHSAVDGIAVIGAIFADYNVEDNARQLRSLSPVS